VSRSSVRKDETFSRCSRETSGPRLVFSSMGSPMVNAFVASTNPETKSSNTDRCTRIRLRAQQS
jgi:hypothetical protein